MGGAVSTITYPLALWMIRRDGSTIAIPAEYEHGQVVVHFAENHAPSWLSQGQEFSISEWNPRTGEGLWSSGEHELGLTGLFFEGHHQPNGTLYSFEGDEEFVDGKWAMVPKKVVEDVVVEDVILEEDVVEDVNLKDSTFDIDDFNVVEGEDEELFIETSGGRFQILDEDGDIFVKEACVDKNGINWCDGSFVRRPNEQVHIDWSKWEDKPFKEQFFDVFFDMKAKGKAAGRIIWSKVKETGNILKSIKDVWF